VKLDQANQPSSYNDRLRAVLPSPERMDGAIIRLTIEYPRECETVIDEASLREYCNMAFEFHLIKRPQMGNRSRLPADQSVNSLTPQELLKLYWDSKQDIDEKSIATLLKLAEEVISEARQDSPG
jgi:exonuclease SbcD